jgi:hypothetical protein
VQEDIGGKIMEEETLQQKAVALIEKISREFSAVKNPEVMANIYLQKAYYEWELIKLKARIEALELIKHECEEDLKEQSKKKDKP